MGMAAPSKYDKEKMGDQTISSKCLVFCHTPKKEFYKKFLFEPFPVESHLNHFINNHLCAEIVAKTIENN